MAIQPISSYIGRSRAHEPTSLSPAKVIADLPPKWGPEVVGSPNGSGDEVAY